MARAVNAFIPTGPLSRSIRLAKPWARFRQFPYLSQAPDGHSAVQPPPQTHKQTHTHTHLACFQVTLRRLLTGRLRRNGEWLRREFVGLAGWLAVFVWWVCGCCCPHCTYNSLALAQTEDCQLLRRRDCLSPASGKTIVPSPNIEATLVINQRLNYYCFK